MDTLNELNRTRTQIRFQKNGQIVEMQGELHRFLVFPQGAPDFNFFALLHPDFRAEIQAQFEQYPKNLPLKQKLTFQIEKQGTKITLQRCADDTFEINFEQIQPVDNQWIAPYLELMDKIHIGICITDESGNYVAVNAAYCQVYGYEKNELIGQHFTIIIPEIYQEKAQQIYDAVMNGTAEQIPTQSKLIRKNEAVIDIEFYTQIIENEDGIRFQMNSVRDISGIVKYKELIRRMQDSAQVGGWELDLATGINTWTSHIYKIYEVPEDFEVTPENGMRFYAPEHIPILQKAIDEALTEGKPFDLELKFIAHTGNQKWVRSTCHPIMGAGKVQVLTGTFQDITKRKEEEIELKKLALLSKHSTNSVVIADENMLVEWVNETFTKDTGYTLAEIRGKKPGDLLQGEESDKETAKRISKKIRQWIPFTETILNYRKNGEKFWNQIEIIPIIENNWIKNWVAIQTDVTEKRRTENKLRFQAKILDNVQDTVLVTNLEANITYVNRSTEKLFGYSQEELMTRTPSLLFIDKAQFLADFEQLQKYGRLPEHRILRQVRTKNGDLLTVEFEISLFYDNENQPIGYIGIGRDVSEILEAKKVLQESEKKYRLLAENTKDLICLHEPDGTYAYVSPSVESMLGFTQADLIGRKPYEFIHPEDLAKAKQKGNPETIKNTPHQVLKYRFRKKDGNYIWLETLKQIIEDENQEVVLQQTSSRDITERHEREKQIFEITQRLKLATQSANLGIWDWKIQTNELIWDEQMYELYGIEKTDFEETYQHWREYILPEDLPIIEAEIQQAIDNQQGLDTVFRIYHQQTQQTRYIRVFAMVVFDEQNKPIRMTGVNSDITDQKIAEKTLQRSLQDSINFRNALNTSTLIAITDLAGQIIEVNDSFCQVAKYSRAELIGQNHRIVNSNYHTKDFWRMMWRTISKGQYWRGEIRNKAKDGEFYWVDTAINPIYDENGKLFRYLSVRSVITRRKKAENERNILINKLVEKNQMLAQFAFITSHKLRKPLANILGLIDLLDMPNLDEAFQEKLMKGLIDSAKELDQEMYNINDTLQIKLQQKQKMTDEL